MATIEEEIDSYRKKEGFSESAWEMFTKVTEENQILGREVERLRDIARRSAIMAQWFSREDYPYIEMTDDEVAAMDRDAKSLTDALQRHGYYAEGWGS